MKDSTTSKEKFLKKIRKALLEKRDNPYPNLEDLPLYPSTTELPEVIFAEEFTKVSGQFIYCEDEIQFIENILLLAEEKKWRKIYCWEPELQELLNRYEYPYYATDKDFELAEVGLTLCEALIARNGSIMVTNANAAGRRLSIFPHCHVVIAYTSQLVMDLKDAFKIIKNKYGNQLPSMISTITGPSRTADIEKTLVLGAHGPKELFVFLLDDSSKRG
ncbi:MAG: lactate utilization protein [Bacteroidetes bacterium]|nr:lactate utilization protein [Bacteroidota bacterium]MBU1374136.1 lactate utilization protein [Bacteroidota bacterium]MBU1484751.1 lactate utilization protein [Bacteroidota bacterium]MBU1760146.1 lactate utilization protein [Bacteroidota bacterium]MBU2269112.1 lactate utilization protein [Bacteroidota bacterium]